MTLRSPVCVLVVEDEFFSRLHAVDVVNDAGFTAIEASNADEAIAILEERKDIRIVLTDINMPGSMDGMELAERVYRRWPHVLLLISSGHARPHPDEIPDHGHFVPKTYIGATLVHHINQMMQTLHNP